MKTWQITGTSKLAAHNVVKLSLLGNILLESMQSNKRLTTETTPGIARLKWLLKTIIKGNYFKGGKVKMYFSHTKESSSLLKNDGLQYLQYK